MSSNSTDRVAFAMQNHARAVKHFREEAARLERIVAVYRAKIDEHIAFARARVDADAFAAWLRDIGEEHGR